VEQVRSGTAGAVVLIVGHSNTVPEMIAAFDVPNPIGPIDEREFDNLFVVSVPPLGQASVLRLKYGKPST
jgi:hypothetical protein